MRKYIPGNQKHLTLDDRKFIESSLNEGLSFMDIARYLCKDPTTISKEIRLHRLDEWYRRGPFYNKKDFCVKRYRCNRTNVCNKIILCGIKCSTCPTCNQIFIGRTYSDFQVLELDCFAEMDTVHSSRDSKRVILTFFLTREKLFLAYIMNRCTKGAVKLIFNKLKRQMGTYDFLTLWA